MVCLRLIRARDVKSISEWNRAKRNVLHGRTMEEKPAATEVGGRTIGTGQIGPITEPLSRLFAGRTATEGVKVM